MPVPKGSPVLLRSMSEMSDDEIDDLVDTIRKRRNTATDVIASGKLLVKQLSDTSLRDKLIKELDKTQRFINQLDVKMDKLDGYILNIRALRMQLE